MVGGTAPRRPSRAALAATAGVLAVLAVALLQLRIFELRGGLFDYFPLYYGAHELLENGDAYGQGPNYPAQGVPGQAGLIAVGNAYPLHAVLLFGLPLAGVAPDVASVIWVAVVGLAWIAAIAWARESWYWLLWLPMWDALRMQQVSAAVTVAGIVALGALRQGRRWPYLMAMLVLTVKPHQTLFLLLAFAVWGRAWWRSLLAVLGSAFVICLLIQPDWVARWLERIVARNDIVFASWLPSIGLVLLGGLLLVRGWRESGLAVLSGAAGSWPLGGTYVASLWPLGTDREQASGMAMVSIMAGFANVMFDSYWAISVTLIAGTAIAAVGYRRPRRDLFSTPADPPPALAVAPTFRCAASVIRDHPRGLADRLRASTWKWTDAHWGRRTRRLT